MKNYQKNLITVLDRLKGMVEADEDLAWLICDDLEVVFDQIAMDDGFGTERQCDPRGDFRDGEWSLWTKVQK